RKPSPSCAAVPITASCPGGKPGGGDCIHAKRSRKPATSCFLPLPPCFPGFRAGGGKAKTAPKGRFYPLEISKRFWSGRRDSNPRPQPWQGCALPLSYARAPCVGAELGGTAGNCKCPSAWSRCLARVPRPPHHAPARYRAG